MKVEQKTKIPVNPYGRIESEPTLCILLPFREGRQPDGGRDGLDVHRRIAMDAELDPNVWEGNVEVGLHRLRDRGHYSRTRHGYYRGDMSVEYAESILRRRNVYQIMLERYKVKPD